MNAVSRPFDPDVHPFEYHRTWNATLDAWMNRADAADFSVWLSHELGINAKGVEVEKDGKCYRVYIPLASMYWSPAPDTRDGWLFEFRTIRGKVKSWAST